MALAGASAQLMAKKATMRQLKCLRVKFVSSLSDAAPRLGGRQFDHENVVLGNAGRSRHMGIRPTVRGTAMNSVDHPHGGGRAVPREQSSVIAMGTTGRVY